MSLRELLPQGRVRYEVWTADLDGYNPEMRAVFATLRAAVIYARDSCYAWRHAWVVKETRDTVWLPGMRV